jgi:rhodanese-related sulfurtransferase
VTRRRPTIPVSVDREEVAELVKAESVQVVEVPQRSHYEWSHIALAEHLPLPEMKQEKVRNMVHAGRPAIVYCRDLE